MHLSFGLIALIIGCFLLFCGYTPHTIIPHFISYEDFPYMYISHRFIIICHLSWIFMKRDLTLEMEIQQSLSKVTTYMGKTKWCEMRGLPKKGYLIVYHICSGPTPVIKNKGVVIQDTCNDIVTCRHIHKHFHIYMKSTQMNITSI